MSPLVTDLTRFFAPHSLLLPPALRYLCPDVVWDEFEEDDLEVVLVVSFIVLV